MGDIVKKADEAGVTEIEEYELEESVSEEGMAVAETIIANLLVKQWLTKNKDAVESP
jgi:hypothetical protein